MKNPVAILKSAPKKDNLVVLIDVVDSFGQAIIVPIRINHTGFTEVGTLIPSVYGKKKIENFLKKEAMAGRVLFIDNKRICKSYLSAESNSPGRTLMQILC